MTALLVFFTAIVALVAQHFVARGHRRVASRACGAPSCDGTVRSAAPEVCQRFHRGHTWARSDSEHLTSIGVSALAANFIGEIDSVETPAVGVHLEPAARALILVARNGRRLRLPIPVGGEVFPLTDSAKRAGYVLAWGDSREDVLATADAALSDLQLVTEAKRS